MRHPLQEKIRQRVELALHDEVVSSVSVQESEKALRDLRGLLERVRDAIEEGEETVGVLSLRVPFRPETVVHEAWSRHPGVRRIFSQHHLSSCDACAVGRDETLAEVALGHRFDLEALLQSLNSLWE